MEQQKSTCTDGAPCARGSWCGRRYLLVGALLALVIVVAAFSAGVCVGRLKMHSGESYRAGQHSFMMKRHSMRQMPRFDMRLGDDVLRRQEQALPMPTTTGTE